MDDNRRILIVDDNRSIHEDFRKVLCPHTSAAMDDLAELESGLFDAAQMVSRTLDEDLIYQVDSAYQGQEGLALVEAAELEGRPYALVFMDVRMPPGWDGIETIDRIWQRHPFIEMVICTAYSDYAWDDIVKKLGKTDKLLFLTKPFDAVTVKQMALTLTKKWNLGKQARNYIEDLEREVAQRTEQLQILLEEVNAKNTALLDVNRELEKAALHDILTDLPNRALFNDRLDHAVKIAKRDNHIFSVLMMDVNKFKEVNDTYGHLTGDTVLHEVGRRIASVLRVSDTVARLGGDEFAAILRGTDTVGAVTAARKIQVAMQSPIIIDERVMEVSTSVGIALFPLHAKNANNLLRFADAAMYQAKDEGTGFAIFDEHRAATRDDMAHLCHDLEHAIKASELQLAYQPVIDLKTGSVCGIEALARWHHPHRGWVTPQVFIDLAEQHGLINGLTLWVADAALTQTAALHAQGWPLHCSINLSARNFLDPNLSGILEGLMRRHGITPSNVTLEITESMMLIDPERARTVLATLDKAGVGISIDDFGTGYSSLVYLKKLPVNELKIDKIFVMDMAMDADNRVIVHSTIEMAHLLGLTVVAEGVETEEALDLLKGFGCDRVQGYFLAEPMFAPQLLEWLRVTPYAMQNKGASS